ncbi:MAG: transposase [Dehalococcoidales bacterium]|nr:transposase [Dehalococcoidales bacterium]
MRKTPLVTGSFYHIFNRGVNKQDIFFEKWDYVRFLKAAIHYKDKSIKFSYEDLVPIRHRFNETGSSDSGARVEVLAYSLMPNHFHFLIKQLKDGGITDYMRRLANGYAHYVNNKHGRVGPLFAGRFKGVLIENDDQLLHLSRYIHLNPLVSGLTDDLKDYPWSSYFSYSGTSQDDLCDPGEILGMFKDKDGYKRFVLDQADYGKRLEEIKHLTIDYQ